MIFLNLTNGIEYIPTLDRFDGFIRLQSTACEQKRWWAILADLDYSFLIPAVSGIEIVVYDTSQRKDVSRALYQGLQWVRFALTKFYFQEEPKTFVRVNNVTRYFTECYKSPDDFKEPALKKLKYVKRVVEPKRPNLSLECMRTQLDGRYERYKEILAEHYGSVAQFG